MNNDILQTASRFINAAASYFGVPPDQLIAGTQTLHVTGTVNVVLRIALTPADLVSIAKRMEQMGESVEAWEPDVDPKGQSVVEPSEGVGGRKVMHVDVPEPVSDAGLPAAVWMPGCDLTEQQKALASDHNPRKDNYLVQACLLDDRQKGVAGVPTYPTAVVPRKEAV